APSSAWGMPRSGGGAALTGGAEGRRQNRDPQVHHGDDPATDRFDRLRWRRDDPTLVASHRPPGYLLLPGGAGHLRQPDREREYASAAGDSSGRYGPRRDLRALPQPA